MRKATGYFLKTLLFLTITALVSEVGLRIYNKINPSFVFPDPTYNRFRGKPLSEDYDFRLNSKGFKDLESGNLKAPGVYRIIAIGDSFAFGVVPYRFNFLTLLEDKLNRTGRAFEVINMGIPKTGVKSYYSLLMNEGRGLSPDMAICCFFIGNDFIEEITDKKDDTGPYLFMLLRFFYKMFTGFEGIQVHGKGAIYEDGRASLETGAFFDIEVGRSQIFIKDNGEFLKLSEEAVSYLKKMKDACTHRDMDFLVVIIPDEVQVNDSLQAVVTGALRDRRFNGLDFELPNKALHEKLERLGISYIDLYDDFRRYSKKARLYKPYDTHWNIAGNALASEIIFERLKSRLH